MFDDRNPSRTTRRRNRGDNPWASLVWGCAILAAGIIGWLDHTGQLHASDYFEWWPLVLIAMGLAHLPKRQWVSAIVMCVIGILFLPELPFLPHMRISMILGVWPLLISAGGVTLIRQALGPTANARRDNSFHAVAVMGGCEINLANAKIESEAVIEVLAFWGGIEIHVPRGWRIENQVLAILGGVVDKTDGNAPAGAPTLIIRGSAIMGGVEIRHPKGL